MNQMLSLTEPQSLALTRLIRHLQAAWQEAEGEVVEEESPFSTGDLDELLLLLPRLEQAQKSGRHLGRRATALR